MRRVSLRTRGYYAVGQVAEGVKNATFNLFLFFYYHQVLGLSGTATGLALFVATTFDAVTDPLAGSISDRLHHRWGRRHPFMYASAVPLGITFALLFRPPDGLSEAGLFAWLLCFTLGVRAAMTLFHVPHLALGAELSSEYGERTAIVAWRSAAGLLGAAFAVGCAWLVFFRSSPAYANGQLDPGAYAPLGLVYGVVIFASVLVSALGTHDRIPELPRPAPGEGGIGLRSFFADYAAVLRNPSFRAIFLGVVVFFVMRGIQEVLGVHMYTYFWQLDTKQIATISLVAFPAFLLGIPLWTGVARRRDKLPTLLTGVACFSVCVLGPPIAALAGFFPERGSAAYIPLLTGAAALAALSATAGLLMGGSMLADVADEHELITGRRNEGILFAALSFAAKSTAGVGSLLAGVGLDAIAFPTQAAPAEVTSEDRTSLGLLYGPGVAALAAVSFALLRGYRIDRARHQEITATLAQRRAQEG